MHFTALYNILLVFANTSIFIYFLLEHVMTCLYEMVEVQQDQNPCVWFFFTMYFFHDPLKPPHTKHSVGAVMVDKGLNLYGMSSLFCKFTICIVFSPLVFHPFDSASCCCPILTFPTLFFKPGFVLDLWFKYLYILFSIYGVCVFPCSPLYSFQRQYIPVNFRRVSFWWFIAQYTFMYLGSLFVIVGLSFFLLGSWDYLPSVYGFMWVICSLWSFLFFLLSSSLELFYYKFFSVLHTLLSY